MFIFMCVPTRAVQQGRYRGALASRPEHRNPHTRHEKRSSADACSLLSDCSIQSGSHIDSSDISRKEKLTATQKDCRQFHHILFSFIFNIALLFFHNSNKNGTYVLQQHTTSLSFAAKANEPSTKPFSLIYKNKQQEEQAFILL